MKNSLLLAGVMSLAIASVAMADDHREKRYRDKNGHDYHTYNDNEDRAYRAYLTEQHRTYRAFDKTNRNQQAQYFKWRHEHSDSVLFKVEIR